MILKKKIDPIALEAVKLLHEQCKHTKLFCFSGKCNNCFIKEYKRLLSKHIDKIAIL
jgi:hypothetical protein